MRHRLSVVMVAAGVAVALSSPAAAQDWTGSGRIVVVVKDHNKKPVAEARITLTLATNESVRPDKDWVTNKKGKFSYLGLKGGSWLLRVEADGFQPWERTVPVYSQGMAETAHVNLTPLPDQVLEAQKRAAAGDRYGHGRELAAAGDLVGARAEYEAVLDTLAPSDQPTVLVAIAGTYMEEGSLSEAEKVLQRSLAIDPGHVGTLRTLCAVVAAQGRIEEAEDLLAMIPESEAVHPTTLINIGMSHYNNGEMERAKPYLDRAIAQHPETATAYYFRGLVNLSVGTPEEARADLEKFLELAPDHPQAAEAKEFLSYLGDAQGDR